MITGWQPNEIAAAAAWSQQYSGPAAKSETTENTDSTTESKPSENPEWERARQELAKVAGQSPVKASKPAQNENTSSNNNVNAVTQMPYTQYYQQYYQNYYQGYPTQGAPPMPFAPYTGYGNNYMPPYPPPPQGVPPPSLPYPGYTPSNQLAGTTRPSAPATIPHSTTNTDNSSTTSLSPNSNIRHQFRPPQPHPQVRANTFPPRFGGPKQQQSGQNLEQNGNQANSEANLHEDGNDHTDYAGPEAGPHTRQNSYANAVKSGQNKGFWKQQSNARLWNQGNKENPAQAKRFKPLSERPWSPNRDNNSDQSQDEHQPPVPNHYHHKVPTPPPAKQPERPKPQPRQEERNDVSVQEWPQSLRDYVQKAFEQCVTESDKDETERYLKERLANAFKDGTAWIIDWDKEDLPSLRGSPPQKPKDDRSLPRWHPSRRRSSPTSRRSPPSRRGSSYSQKKRGRSRSHSRSRSPSRSSSPGSPREGLELRERLDARKISRKAELKAKTPKKGNKNKNKKNSMKGQVLGYVEEDPEAQHKIQQRAQRFKGTLSTPTRSSPSILSTINATMFIDRDNEESDWSKFHVIGICQSLEKKYYRLNTAPDATTVRPKEVLKKSLEMVKDHWKTKQDYVYACEQFKSIRQDLTVQGIRDEFTVEVYETHARVALEKGDREEFNQCQTQLKALYASNAPGHVREFTAYRLLYHIMIGNTLEVTTEVLKLTPGEKADPAIKHALQFYSARALSNYHNFFQLYLSSPNMSAYLVDLFIQRERTTAIKVLIKSYRPTLPVSFVQSELGFPDEGECRKFLDELGAKLTADGNKLDCRLSQDVLAS